MPKIESCSGWIVNSFNILTPLSFLNSTFCFSCFDLFTMPVLCLAFPHLKIELTHSPGDWNTLEVHGALLGAVTYTIHPSFRAPGTCSPAFSVEVRAHPSDLSSFVKLLPTKLARTPVLILWLFQSLLWHRPCSLVVYMWLWTVTDGSEASRQNQNTLFAPQ